MEGYILKLSGVLLLLLGFSNCQSCYLYETCPSYNESQNCSYPIDWFYPLWFWPPPPVNCTEKKNCTNDGCRQTCTFPEFFDENCTDPNNETCKCYLGRSFEEICPEGQLCCQDDNCTYVCKEKVFTNYVLPEPPSQPYNKSYCNSISNQWCYYGYQCCENWGECVKGYCEQYVCSYYEYKQAVCPTKYDVEDPSTELLLCDRHEDCTSGCQLCCRFFSDINTTFCRDPVYVPY